MKIALVDDELFFHKQFITALRKNGFNNSIDCYVDPDSFIIKATVYDAVFLDIDFGSNKNGIDFAARLKKINSKLIVVFVTAHSEIIYDAFGINVLAFLNKSELDYQLRKIMIRLKNEVSSRDKVVLILDNHRTFVIEISKVLYCDISLRKTRLIDTEGHIYHLKYRKISELYSFFGNYPFVYINRSCFVNIQRIDSFGNGILNFRESSLSLGYSRDKYKSIKEAFINYNAVGSAM